MKIVHKVSDISEIIFPWIVDKSDDEIIQILTEYYTYWTIKPVVSIDGWVAIIEIDIESVDQRQSTFSKAEKEAQRWKLDKAKRILKDLLQQNPHASEAHRLLWQIESDQWNQSEAEGYLINALKYDPNNEWALIMLWNVYRKLDKLDLSETLYKRAIELNDSQELAYNNLASIYLQTQRIELGYQTISSVLELNPSFAMAWYTKWLACQQSWRYLEGYESAVKSIRLSEWKAHYVEQAIWLSLNCAMEYAKSTDISDHLEIYRSKLSITVGKEIKIIEDSSIKTPAKLEVAEVHNRDYHVVKIQPNNPNSKHLVFHELKHLDLIARARVEWNNRIVYSTQSQKSSLVRDIISQLNPVIRAKLHGTKIDEYATSLGDWIVSQIFNWPLDLVIEYELYEYYPFLRPIQFVSLLTLSQQYYQIAESQATKLWTPKFIRETSNIINYTHLLQFQEFYWVKPKNTFSQPVIRKATKLYEATNFKEVADWEEYTFVNKRSTKLNVSKYLTIENEQSFLEGQIETLNQPNKIDIRWDGFDSLIQRVQDNWKYNTDDLNMAVVMYCLDALEYFYGKSKEEIQKVAFEIGILWSNWIDYSDSDKVFTIKSVPDKEFSGFHLLSYYFVWFKLLESNKYLWLDYDDEYKLAKSLFSWNL